MSRPYTQPSKRTLLAAVTGGEPPREIPTWMKREFGYIHDNRSGGNTRAQKKKRKK